LNKYDFDFSFLVKYGDLNNFNPTTLNIIESSDLFRVNVQGVKDAFEKYKDRVSKGLRIHFNNDDSSVLNIDKIDISFEEKEEEVGPVDDESTLSKIGSKISSFFGSNTNAENDKDENLKNPEKVDEDNPKNQKVNNTDNSNATFTSGSNSSSNATNKLKIVKENLKFEMNNLAYADMNSKEIKEKKEKLKTLKDKETDKRKRASSINTLETFIYDTKSKFYDDAEFLKCVKDEDKEEILGKLNEANDWLFDTDDLTETKVIFFDLIKIL
jgi:hypothetical protein